MNSARCFTFFLSCLGGVAALSVLSSCESGPTWYDQMRDPHSGYYTGRWDGTRPAGYPGTGDPRDTTINHEVLDSMSPSSARIEIDLGEQKARLYKVGGGGRELAVETPVSTGMKGRRTPTGNFTILEKSPTKSSTLYGSWVDGRSGALLQGDGDSRRRPSGAGGSAEFQGASMPYWLRVTNDGVGMHIGYVPSYPASHGCIRVPRRVQTLIYDKVKVGTPVTIRE